MIFRLCSGMPGFADCTKMGGSVQQHMFVASLGVLQTVLAGLATRDHAWLQSKQSDIATCAVSRREYSSVLIYTSQLPFRRCRFS